MGCHHHGFALYHSTVAASPSANTCFGFHPSAPKLRRVESIPTVVSQPVGHGLNQGVRLARERQDSASQLNVGYLVSPSDVVDLPVDAAVDDKVDGAAVVLHVEPIAHVQAVAVQRQGPVLQGVRDEQRNHLLGELVGAVVVRGTRHDDRHADRWPSSCRPGGRRRLCWPSTGLRGFSSSVSFDAPVGTESVDLVGRNLDEPPQLVGVPRRFEQCEGAEDIRLDELVGVCSDRSTCVSAAKCTTTSAALTRGALTAESLISPFTNVCLGSSSRSCRFSSRRIRQLVQGGDPPVGMRAKHMSDEIAADESGAAGNQNARSCRFDDLALCETLAAMSFAARIGSAVRGHAIPTSGSFQSSDRSYCGA